MNNPTAKSIADTLVLAGWIKPCNREVVSIDRHRQNLEALGVEVGAWDMFDAEFVGCRVSNSALVKLEDLWGEYIWGLE